MSAAGPNARALPTSTKASGARSIKNTSGNSVTNQIVGRLAVPTVGPIIGIDVGEDFLDLAVFGTAGKDLRLVRVAVTSVERREVAKGGAARAAIPNDGGAIGELGRRLLEAAPELGTAGAIVLVDSPRWPRDLDLAMRGANGGGPLGSARAAAARAIDTSLRTMVRGLALQNRDGMPFRLAMFPTPKFEFFAACACDPRCKPHLAAIARELFGAALERAPAMLAPAGGGIFTRFMIAGFAAYCALERTSAALYEAFPDLAFRLWARDGEEIPPKRMGRAALNARQLINRRLADKLGYAGAEHISTLDEADASILALSAAAALRGGAIAVIEHPPEGCFALALGRDQARSIMKSEFLAKKERRDPHESRLLWLTCDGSR